MLFRSRRIERHGVDGEIAPGEIGVEVGGELDVIGMPGVGVGALAAEGGALDLQPLVEHEHGAEFCLPARLAMINATVFSGSLRHHGPPAATRRLLFARSLGCGRRLDLDAEVLRVAVQPRRRPGLVDFLFGQVELADAPPTRSNEAVDEELRDIRRDRNTGWGRPTD